MLQPVAQAVMVAMMGPVAPVIMDTLPPDHVDAGVGVGERMGQLVLIVQEPVGADDRIEAAHS